MSATRLKFFIVLQAYLGPYRLRRARYEARLINKSVSDPCTVIEDANDSSVALVSFLDLTQTQLSYNCKNKMTKKKNACYPIDHNLNRLVSTEITASLWAVPTSNSEPDISDANSDCANAPGPIQADSMFRLRYGQGVCIDIRISI